jgi:hypothetical protein
MSEWTLRDLFYEWCVQFCGTAADGHWAELRVGLIYRFANDWPVEGFRKVS